MGKTSIEYLFTNEKTRKPTGDWAQALRNAKDKYGNCRVVSFTRVKDLNSDWKHEYVQFIVEEESTKDRARIYAERGNEKDLDWVTFGPAETVTTGSKHDKDLPLPLTSLIFGGQSGDDIEKRPTVLEIAEILAAATIIGGGYELFGHSCFWYAYTVTDAIERAFGKWATKKSWRWVQIGGAGGGGFQDAWGLGVPMLFKFIYVGDAERFKKEREVNMNYDLDDDRGIIDPNGIVAEVASELKKEKYLQEYINAMQQQGINLSKADVQERLVSGRTFAAKETPKEANWTEEFEKLNSTVVKNISADPEATSYIRYYEEHESSASRSEGDDDEYSGPKADEVNATQQALRVVVGRILDLAQKNQV